MRRLSAVLAATAILTSAGACSGSNAEHVASGVTATSDTTPPVSSRDRTWLVELHRGNLGEIRLGELARKNGGTPAVRAAGSMLVTDHTAADTEVTRVADSVGITLPSSLTPSDAAAVRRLRAESGPRFDQDFRTTLTTAHQQIITDTQAEISQGSATPVRQLAERVMPTLHKHLDTLQKATGSG